jgi:hypothetical protein
MLSFDVVDAQVPPMFEYLLENFGLDKQMTFLLKGLKEKNINT